MPDEYGGDKAGTIGTAAQTTVLTGPDYFHGWGACNALGAADLLAANFASDSGTVHLRELILFDGSMIEFPVRHAPIGPVASGVPYARSTHRATRTWVGINDIRELEEYQDLKGPKELLDQGIEVHEITTGGVSTKVHVRHFLGSGAACENLGKQTLAAGGIGGHWGVANRNHYRRDASRWREDNRLRRKVKGSQNMALVRNA